ncbi:DNA-binding protein [Tardiphaga alba]|uniref:DNA-binding protein n=1 Tax=Tardiphaga alba TaxID=340268 RepID=A0ABX8A5D5_9BRAD|nr:helix-turn-helix domain-containing protein [Tardiphaga alba]QUS38627.1 DNA-binding protein [Tardiphaga alba]
MSSLLTQKEAAKILKLSTRTLERLRVNGNGPKYSKLGGVIRYQPACLTEWVDACSRQSTSHVTS